jgi:hypothetical protein
MGALIEANGRLYGFVVPFEADLPARPGISMAPSGCQPTVTEVFIERKFCMSSRLGMRAVITSP